MRSTLNNYLPGILLFVLFSIMSLFIFRDYGISWDETIQRQMGLVSYNYITDKNDYTLDTYIERDHGTGFEVPLIFIEKALRLKDTADIYHMRHLISNLFFLVSCFFGYILSYRLFRNKLIASIGFLMFALQPRIYAHSYFNTKDLPFLSMFLISSAICQIAFDKNRKYWYLLAGAACGYATSIRILGILLLGIFCLCLLIDMIAAISKKENTRNSIVNLLLFISGFCIILYICFPTLWAHPITSFVEVFKSLSHFRWPNFILFRGQQINAADLPWTYLPVWFSITMPVLWLILGLIGFFLIIIHFTQQPATFINNTLNRNFIIYLALFILPVAMIIVLRSVVYDDWRHVYFIYPSFALLVLYALNKLYHSKAKNIALILVLLQFAETTVFMIRSHPHQQVYFNQLVAQKPEQLRANYELEYWGCSFKQGLEYILAHDKSGTIKINAPYPELTSNNLLILTPEQRKRIQIVDGNDDAYFITNFRWHPHDFPYGKAMYEIKVCNSTILRIYSFRKL